MPERPTARKNSGGAWGVLAREARLTLRLLLDKRVPWHLKLLPVGAVAYLVWPADLLPLNPLDDAALVSLALYFFVELAPKEVVTEHREALQHKGAVVPGAWRDADDTNGGSS